MAFVGDDVLCCPLDYRPLRPQDNRLLCENGHSFDVARQGYVNLLSASDKRSREPGDSRAMVAARREFLDAGYYQPVAENLARILLSVLPANAVVVDAGCGEGYYLQQLRRGLSPAGVTRFIGFDISKWAVRAAAGRCDASWLVASNRHIPLTDHSVDVVLCMFGFPAYPSFHRILKAGGSVLLVGPGPRHLIELREVIYPSVSPAAPTASPLAPARAAGFTLADEAVLHYRTPPLCPSHIQQLLAMTPHGFRMTRQGSARAAVLRDFPVTVDVVFQRLVAV